MSASEILTELPKLSHVERRAICQRILELEAEREALQLAAEATELAFREMDRDEQQASEDSRTSR